MKAALTCFLLLCAAAGGAGAQTSSPAGRVTGIGGIFEAWGGALLRYDSPGHPPVATWNAFSNSSKYMAPSTREFMINFAVDDLDALVTRLKAKGVSILKRDDSDPSGRFAWVTDPDGTKLELWQPKSK